MTDLTQHFLSRLILQSTQEFPDNLIGQNPAAVLIPLVKRGEGLHVVMTQRSFSLRHHPGQICFPGGRYDTNDILLSQTALRETEEELGISMQQIQLLRELPIRHTLTGFNIRPYIGLLHPPYQYQINQDEVLAVFEIPLSQLLTPHAFQKLRIIRRGSVHEIIGLTINDWFIWGATARILHSLMEEYGDNLEARPGVEPG